MQIALLVIGGAMVFVVIRYYWLRILACGMLLLVWGIVAVAGPLYIAVETLQRGQIDEALLTLLICGVTGSLWYIAFMQARDWFRRTRRTGFFKKRWNAR